MKVSFRYAYESLLKLKKKDDNKVAILFSVNINRVRQLVEFFVAHSNFAISKISFSELAQQISHDGKTLERDAKRRAIRYMKKHNPEYIILEDKGVFPKEFSFLDEFFEIVREVGKKIPVIVVTELPGEFSLLYGTAEMIDIPGLNEHSLRIRASTLGTEELYLRNECEALSSGVFWANKDFYDNYIEKKRIGDELFIQGNYQEAFESYNEAIAFHSKFDDDECVIDNFLGVVLYIRCIACFLYGKWPERTKANSYMKECVNDIMHKLKRSLVFEKHAQMLKEYDLTFLGVRDGWLERSNFVLFLQEYIF